MTLFSLGIFEHSATWSQLLRNLAWTVPGNIVGGGLLIGIGYAWVGGVGAPARTSMEREPVSMEGVPEPAMAD
jgi:nitrite transporter NirC